jgi:hypothetical protein
VPHPVRATTNSSSAAAAKIKIGEGWRVLQEDRSYDAQNEGGDKKPKRPRRVEGASTSEAWLSGEDMIFRTTLVGRRDRRTERF